ncbi:MAG: DNA-formamidopyrimidine glycosylase family protein [Verrucomicrobiota bacterium]
MPELPEVEIMVRQLRPHLRGRTIRRVEVCDPKIKVRDTLTGYRIMAIRRRAKFIIFDLSNDRHLLVHLRMTGWFEFVRPMKYRFAIHAGKAVAYFADSRRFGVVELLKPIELVERLARLGPEPFVSDLAALKRTTRPVKVALLDQALVAGIGNIYACESLWRARINPRRRADRLTVVERRRLQRCIVAALRKGIKYGPRIFAVQEFYVYDRAGRVCRRCGTLIRRIVQAQRSTWFCPHCQRR